VTWVSRLVGKLMMLMASKGHFLGQIPHPMHRRSEMKAILDSGVTSMHSLPVRTTGHDFLHSCLHFFGLHCHGEDGRVSRLTRNFLWEGQRGVPCPS
jgi:hypothetical protein